MSPSFSETKNKPLKKSARSRWQEELGSWWDSKPRLTVLARTFSNLLLLLVPVTCFLLGLFLWRRGWHFLRNIDFRLATRRHILGDETLGEVLSCESYPGIKLLVNWASKSETSCHCQAKTGANSRESGTPLITPCILLIIKLFIGENTPLDWQCMLSAKPLAFIAFSLKADKCLPLFVVLETFQWCIQTGIFSLSSCSASGWVIFTATVC
jgi:hypothetical protein